MMVLFQARVNFPTVPGAAFKNKSVKLTLCLQNIFFQQIQGVNLSNTLQQAAFCRTNDTPNLTWKNIILIIPQVQTTLKIWKS
jgi:hypothetical protein